MEYLTSSKRWSRNDSDMEPLKSSIGEISSKMSSSPERSGTSSRPAARASATRSCQRSLPRSQSKALGLQGEEVGDLQGLTDLAERETARSRQCGGHGLGRGARGSQGWSFHWPCVFNGGRTPHVDRSALEVERTSHSCGSRVAAGARRRSLGESGRRSWAGQSNSLDKKGATVQPCPIPPEGA